MNYFFYAVITLTLLPGLTQGNSISIRFVPNPSRRTTCPWPLARSSTPPCPRDGTGLWGETMRSILLTIKIRRPRGMILESVSCYFTITSWFVLRRSSLLLLVTLLLVIVTLLLVIVTLLLVIVTHTLYCQFIYTLVYSCIPMMFLVEIVYVYI